MRAHRALLSLPVLLLALIGLTGASLAAGPILWELRPSVGLDVSHILPTARDMAVALVPWLPPLRLHTLLVSLHLAGLCFGLGGVFVLDILLLKATLRRHFHPRNANMVWILSQTTTLGLLLLWISGIGLLLLAGPVGATFASNPKLIAKIAVVLALSLNGVLIHRVCLPRLMSDLTPPLMAKLSRPTRTLMLFSGSVSSVSWCFAAFLGTAKELNGTVGAAPLLVTWALIVLLAFAASTLTLLPRQRV
ncbi:hypothetical protein [Aureimonas ureilytica]|uniref:hypothetical protein n=1 Tax=Aureimonas ureilytica TaxID=401562 RepID=UPI000368E3B5|nr:hypothetical protein [Aureimonas ureilytica]